MSYRDYEPVDLARAGFKIHQLESLEKDNIENAFSGFVEEALGKINDGKEATVYLCRAAGKTGAGYLAAKLYRARVFRAFDTDRSYRNFGKMRDRRMAKAMRNRSKRGERYFHAHWIESEYRFLERLYSAGVSVPRPYMYFGDGLLMDFIGDEQGPAPMLIDCKLEPARAEALLAEIIADVRVMLDNDIVHGDLSAYNILYTDAGHAIIDLPQAMDVRTTPDARRVLERDLANLQKYFRKYDLEVPVHEILSNL